MTKKEIFTLLTEWEQVQKDLDARLNQLNDLLGACDSPFLDAIYRLSGAHTSAVAKLVGDKAEWLEWWHFECCFGDRDMGSVQIGGKSRQVRTLKQLAAVIAA